MGQLPHEALSGQPETHNLVNVTNDSQTQQVRRALWISTHNKKTWKANWSTLTLSRIEVGVSCRRPNDWSRRGKCVQGHTITKVSLLWPALISGWRGQGLPKTTVVWIGVQVAIYMRLRTRGPTIPADKADQNYKTGITVKKDERGQ